MKLPLPLGPGALGYMCYIYFVLGAVVADRIGCLLLSSESDDIKSTNSVSRFLATLYSALQIVREFVFRVHNGPLKITCGARSFVFRFLMGAYSIHSFH